MESHPEAEGEQMMGGSDQDQESQGQGGSAHTAAYEAHGSSGRAGQVWAD